MTHDGQDPMVGSLRALLVEPPHSMVNIVYSNWVRVDGPLGGLYVAFTATGIDYLRPADLVHDDSGFQRSYHQRYERPLRKANRPPAGLLAALRGGRPATLRFDLRGLTGFERDVLEATRRIPRGQTRPYGWVAERIGRPKAVRAVGTALGRNPVPILIPCHRVTRATGEPGDYVFGRPAKQTLLRAEDVNLDEVAELARRGVFFIGSDTTGIVCFPTCAHARRITTEHRHGFRTVGQAVGAGYRPCRQCAP